MTDKQIRILQGVLDMHNSRKYNRTYFQPELAHPKIDCGCDDCRAILKVLKLNKV